jgi:asparagine synthase (glutamine-hydrolysing)
MDQPTTDGFNNFFLARAASDTGIKVWLSGVGGDELFGGYPSFSRLGYLKAWSAVLQRLMPRSAALNLAARSSYMKLSRLLHLGVEGDSTLRAYQACRLIVPPANARQFLRVQSGESAASLQRGIDGFYPRLSESMDSHQTASILESSVYMRSQLLRDIDNFSMSASIEVRAPFLDHDLFRQIWRLPRSSKKYNRNVKPLLIDIVPNGLPHDVPLDKKRGFTFPVARWAREGMAVHFRDVVMDPVNGDYWVPQEVEKLWRAYERGRVHWMVLWMLYSFARWRGTHPC